MRLFAYFLRAYLGAAAAICGGLAALVALVTLVENAGELGARADGGRTALRLAALGCVEYAHQTLPLAALLALLVVATRLGRSGELLAVQAAGGGPWRCAGPFVLGALALAALALVSGEWLLPRAVGARARLQAEAIGHLDPLTSYFDRRNQWLRQGDWVLHLPHLEPATQRFAGPTAYRLEGGQIATLVQARALAYRPAEAADRCPGWCLLEGHLAHVGRPEEEAFAALPLPFTATAADLVAVAGNPRQLRRGQIEQLVARRRRGGFDVTPHRLEWHGRLAQPAAAVALTGLGAAWSLRPTRRRSLAASVGGGLLLVVAFLAVGQCLRLLALGRHVAAPWGAWGGVAAALAALPPTLWWRRRHGVG